MNRERDKQREWKEMKSFINTEMETQKDTLLYNIYVDSIQEGDAKESFRVLTEMIKVMSQKKNGKPLSHYQAYTLAEELEDDIYKKLNKTNFMEHEKNHELN